MKVEGGLNDIRRKIKFQGHLRNFQVGLITTREKRKQKILLTERFAILRELVMVEVIKNFMNNGIYVIIIVVGILGIHFGNGVKIFQALGTMG